MHSELTNYVRLSPNCTKPRNKKIDAIVIHHVAGTGNVEAVGALFADPKRQASANYGVDSQGRIACFVEEDDRAFTTSNAAIDHRAVTIEVSNCGGAPNWPVSDQALEATIALCADICRRHGFRLNYTGDKSGNLHMHKWYAATACPGPYLAAKFPYIAKAVNKLLDEGGEPEREQAATSDEGQTDQTEAGYNLKLRILAEGDSGDDVRALQQLLKANGYDLGSYGPKGDGIDGQYGAATAKAVRKLEEDRDLAQDEGTAGPQVMSSLLGV